MIVPINYYPESLPNIRTLFTMHKDHTNNLEVIDISINFEASKLQKDSILSNVNLTQLFLFVKMNYFQIETNN